jgi:hypothetical protein
VCLAKFIGLASNPDERSGGLLTRHYPRGSFQREGCFDPVPGKQTL